MANIEAILRKTSAAATLGVVSAMSVFSSASIAFAATGDSSDDVAAQATVTLTDPEHGTLSFEGTDEKSQTVDTKSEVTIDVTAEDGYSISYLSVYDSSNASEEKTNDDGTIDASTITPTVVAVKDGKATVTVDADMGVTATATPVSESSTTTILSETSTVSEDAIDSDSDSNDESANLFAYICDHLDESYVGHVTDDTKVSWNRSLGVIESVVDGSKIVKPTYDSINDDVDTASVLVNTASGTMLLFDFDTDGEYAVGRLNTQVDGMALGELYVEPNDNTEAVFDAADYHYDESTGLLYVKRSVIEDAAKTMAESLKSEDGTSSDSIDMDNMTVYNCARVSTLFYTTSDTVTSHFNINVNSDGVAASHIANGDASVDGISKFTEIQLSSDSVNKITLDMIDSVLVNGISCKIADAKNDTVSDDGTVSLVHYDEDTQILTISMTSDMITDVNINMSDNFFKAIGRFFTGIGDAVSNVLVTKAYAARKTNYAGTAKFHGSISDWYARIGTSHEYSIETNEYNELYAENDSNWDAYDDLAVYMPATQDESHGGYYVTRVYTAFGSTIGGEGDYAYMSTVRFCLNHACVDYTFDGLTMTVESFNSGTNWMVLNCIHPLRAGTGTYFYGRQGSDSYADESNGWHVSGGWGPDTVLRVALAGIEDNGNGTYRFWFNIAVAYGGQGYQQGVGVYYYDAKPDSIDLKIEKTLANSEGCTNAMQIAATNSDYSLAGAQYGVFTDATCQTYATDAETGAQVILTMESASGTDAITGTCKIQPNQTYYIKEITPPSCGLYGLDTTVYTIYPTENTVTKVSESPDVDPLSVWFGKSLGSDADADSGHREDSEPE